MDVITEFLNRTVSNMIVSQFSKRVLPNQLLYFK